MMSGVKKAGEHVVSVKNGYIVRQAEGNTVAAAIIQGETMFQENMMNFNVNTFKQLKKEYEKAVKAGQKSFMFNGQELLVDYAKYLIQYLEPKFGGIREAFMPGHEGITEYIKPIDGPAGKPFVLNTRTKGHKNLNFVLPDFRMAKRCSCICLQKAILPLL